MTFSSKKNRIIVIGGNAAGPAAAAKAKRTDPNASVTLIEASEFISTGTCEIPYVLSKEISDVKKIIFYDNQKFKEEKGVDVLTKNVAESINRKNKTIQVRNLNDGSVYTLPYNKLIIATGSKAKKIRELEEKFQNVFTLKSVTDLIRLQNFISKMNPRNAVVIGAGYIGIEIAESLKNSNIKVTLIEKGSFTFPESEPEIQNLILNVIRKNDIDFIGGYSKIGFHLNDESIRIVVDGRIIESDFIIQCIGIEPNSQLAISSGLSVGSFLGVLVDQKLRTSDQNIFAAGDVIEIINKVTRKKDYLPFATFAHQFGHIAGTNAAGGNEFYQPVIKNIAIRVFENTFSSVGITKAEADKFGLRTKVFSAVANNIIKVMPASKKVFGKINLEVSTNKILGASFWGGDEVIGYADIISSFIANDLSAEKLSNLNFNYTPPKSPYINLLSVLGRKAKEAK